MPFLLKVKVHYLTLPPQSPNLSFAGNAYLVSQGMLFEVMRLNEFHATFSADIWTDVFVLHCVILQLTRVLKCFVTFVTPVECWASVRCKMPL